MIFRSLCLMMVLFCTAPAARSAWAQEPAGDAGGEGTGAAPAANPSGLPIPRFVSLRSGEINLRTGPGVRYPIEWVYRREGLPVEITAEYDTWRRIRDQDGAEGWVHQSMLSGRRAVAILDAAATAHTPNGMTDPDQADARPVTPQPLYTAANSQAALAARAMPGAIGELVSCEGAWCQVKFTKDSVKGWLPKGTFYGAYDGEVVK